MASKAQKQRKVAQVMGEYKRGTLNSGKPSRGSKNKVKSRKQAIAIALSEAERMGRKGHKDGKGHKGR